MEAVESGASPANSGTIIQSVVRASRLLFSIAEHPSGISVRQLSEMHDLTLPTVHNMVRTLASVGLVARSRELVLLGPMAGVIAGGYDAARSVNVAYAQQLRALTADTGETAYLGELRGAEVLLIDAVESTQPLRVVPRPLGRDVENGHARATVKVLLAYASEEVRAAVMSRFSYEALTEQTLTDSESFLAELPGIRESGVAYDVEERLTGACCISVPIFTGTAANYCYSLHMPAVRFYENRDELTRIALDHAALVSH